MFVKKCLQKEDAKRKQKNETIQKKIRTEKRKKIRTEKTKTQNKCHVKLINIKLI